MEGIHGYGIEPESDPPPPFWIAQAQQAREKLRTIMRPIEALVLDQLLWWLALAEEAIWAPRRS